MLSEALVSVEMLFEWLVNTFCDFETGESLPLVHGDEPRIALSPTTEVYYKLSFCVIAKNVPDPVEVVL